MSNKNYPGNESFTITLTDLWYFSEIKFSEIGHSISAIAEWSDCTNEILPTAFIFS